MRHTVRNTDGEQSAIRVWAITSDDNLAKRIESCTKVEDQTVVLESRSALDDLSEEDDIIVDVLILDVCEQHEQDSRLRDLLRGILKDAKIVVLCEREQSEYWRNQVLLETVFDYFVIRPAFDLDYLKVQIWRVVRGMAQTLKPRRSVVAEVPEATEKSFALESQKGGRFRGRQALIVESDIPSANALRDMLLLEGFDVAIGSSVMNASVRHRNKIFDIVFLDLRLPGVSGPEAIPVMRNQIKAKVAIVVTSASSDEALVRACVREGIQDYLVKPIRRKALIPRVDSVLAASASS